MVDREKPAELTIPCHWNRETMSEILDANETASVRVGEVYGVLARGGPVGHGRSPDSVVDVTQQDAVTFREGLRERNIRFSYLMNAPFGFTGEAGQTKKLDQYLEWVLGDLKPDALTISSHALMRHVRETDQNVDLHVSTIAGVQTPQDLQTFMDVRPNRVVPHHNAGKDWNKLNDLVTFSEREGVEVELLVTESCLYSCPQRKAHYEYLARGKQDEPFHLTCNARKLIRPSEILMAGGIVRPEDIQLFEPMGVDYFKISGRSKPAEWLPEVVQAYQKRDYEGNLVRLLGIDPSLEAENWLRIDNKALDGFLKSFPAHESDEVRRAYCEKWTVRLHKQGNLEVNDGSKYTTQEGELRLVGDGGFRVAPIIRREIGSRQT